MPGASAGAVLERTDTVITTKVETEPQLGGQGSGFPPRFMVATGSLGHSIIGIDIGSQWTRVAVLEQNVPRMLSPPISSLLQLIVDAPGSYTVPLGPSYSLLGLIGTDWNLESNQNEYKSTSIEALLDGFLAQLIEHSQKSALHLIKKCVLTVPASFTCERRKALREVVEKTGLEVLNLLNEPTAAALAYVHQSPYIEGNVLIVGMGANHFATSLIEIRNGLLETRATSADNSLGGEDFDNLLIEWFFEKFEEKFKVPLPRVRANVGRFKKAAERAKMDLTMAAHTFVRFTALEAVRGKLDFTDYDLFLDIDREQFAEMSASLVGKAVQHVHNTLLESRLNPADVDYVIPVGSASQMPILLNALKGLFPAGRRWNYANMPNAAAIGAAIQASILTRTLHDYVVWDVLAVPISAELPDGSCKVILRSGTPLPITGYYQVESEDATVNLNVLQGYSERASENCSIAEVTVNNCPPTAGAGTKIEIAVMVRADGTIDFSARHVELQGNLPVSVRRGHPASYRERSFKTAPHSTPHQTQDPVRFERLTRMLNMTSDETKATLRTLNYSPAEIASGTAVESLIRDLRRPDKRR